MKYVVGGILMVAFITGVIGLISTMIEECREGDGYAGEDPLAILLVLIALVAIGALLMAVLQHET